MAGRLAEGDAGEAALNAARKSQQKDRTLVLSTILANVKNREIELGRDPTDEEVVEVTLGCLAKSMEDGRKIRDAGIRELLGNTE